MLKKKVYRNPECAAEAQAILEIYMSYLTNQNLPQESNITNFGEMILYHTKEFEIHRNSHNMNIFILKSHYFLKTSSDQPFDYSMDFFKNATKVVMPFRKTISSLDLSLDKHNRFYSFQTYLINRFDN